MSRHGRSSLSPDGPCQLHSHVDLLMRMLVFMHISLSRIDIIILILLIIIVLTHHHVVLVLILLFVLSAHVPCYVDDHDYSRIHTHALCPSNFHACVHGHARTDITLMSIISGCSSSLTHSSLASEESSARDPRHQRHLHNDTMSCLKLVAIMYLLR